MSRASIDLSPPLLAAREEAERIGLSFPALLTADLKRYRAMAAAATPALDEWEWWLIGHILAGREQADVLTGIDDLPSRQSIVADIDDWADGALDDETVKAGELRAKVMAWSPLAIAGVLFRLRQP